MTKKEASDLVQGARIYNSYYGGYGNEKSIYQQRYNDSLHTRNLNSLKKIIQKICKEKSPGDTVRVLDFGFGDGRTFEFYEGISKILAKQELKLELVAYDVSSGGLSVFQKKMKKKGYSEEIIEDLNKEETHTRSYISSRHKKANISITTIHGSFHDNYETKESLIGKVDFSVVLFGVMSHITNKEDRNSTYQFIQNVTSENGYAFFTVPHKGKRFKQEQLIREYYENEAKEKEQKPKHEKALSNYLEKYGIKKEKLDELYSDVLSWEKGVIKYTRIDQNTNEVMGGKKNPEFIEYKLFKRRGWQEELENSGFIKPKIRPNFSKKELPNLLSKGAFAMELDGALCWATPRDLVDAISSYMQSSIKIRNGELAR